MNHDGNSAPPTKDDRRKYQRVQFDASPQTLAVTIVGYGGSVVFDMSYSGSALAQPEEKKVVTTGGTVSIHLKSGEIESTVESRVVRCTDKIFAVEFLTVPSDARILIDRLISDRMIGINMNLIDPKHYNTQSGFSHWFHGPKETNLFLWSTNDKLSKAQLDLNNVVLIYEDDSFIFENKGESKGFPALNHQQIMQKALSIISQMHSNVVPLNELKSMLEQQLE